MEAVSGLGGQFGSGAWALKDFRVKMPDFEAWNSIVVSAQQCENYRLIWTK
jgi:hypothetical protein